MTKLNELGLYMQLEGLKKETTNWLEENRETIENAVAEEIEKERSDPAFIDNLRSWFINNDLYSVRVEELLKNDITQAVVEKNTYELIFKGWKDMSGRVANVDATPLINLLKEVQK